MSKFEKLKLPSYGQMGGVAFHASALQLSKDGPRVLVFGAGLDSVLQCAAATSRREAPGTAVFVEEDVAPLGGNRTSFGAFEMHVLRAPTRSPQRAVQIFDASARPSGRFPRRWRGRDTSRRFWGRF